jgi:WD40 repeat protein
MNQTTTRAQTPVLEIVILFGAFSILLSILLIDNATLVNQINVQNIDQVHEVFQIDTQRVQEPIIELLLSKDDNTLIAATTRTNYVWNLANSTQQMTSVDDTGGAIFDISFVGDKPVAEFGNWQRTIIRLMDMATGQTLRQFDLPDPRGVRIDRQISHDGHWFALSVDNTTMTIFDVKTGESSIHLSPPEGYLFSDRLALSPNNRFLAALMYMNTCNCKRIVVWDVSTGYEINQFELDKNVTPYSLVFSEDDNLLILSGSYSTEESDAYVQIWKLDTDTKLAEWSGGGLAVGRLLISPDNQYIAAHGYGDVWLWDIKNISASAREILHLKNPDGNSVGYFTMAVNNDWTLLATSDTNGNILIYDIQTAKLIKTLAGHTNYVNQILFSDDQRFIISSGYDGIIRFWSVSAATIKPFTKTDTIALPTMTVSPTPSQLELNITATAFAATFMPISPTPGKN